MVSITFFNTYLNGITDRENLQPYTYKKIRVTASDSFLNRPAKSGGRSTRVEPLVQMVSRPQLLCDVYQFFLMRLPVC